MVKTVLLKYIFLVFLFIQLGCSGGSGEIPSLLTPPDTESPTVTSVTEASSGTYIYDQNLAFTLSFSENVFVTGTPVLELTIDGSLVSLPYISGSGTQALGFNKNIDFERVDNDGIDFDAINLSGGTIQDASGNDAVLTMSSINYPTILVDSVRPVFTSVMFNTGEAYTQNTAATINSVVTGASEILVSTISDCSDGSWVAYNSALAHTLSLNTTNDNYISYKTSAGSTSDCHTISITHDNLIPNAPTINHAGDATLSQTDTASWLSVSDNGPSGILRYEYAVSTSTSESNIITGGGWVDLGTSLSHQITTGITLTAGTDYYTLVKSVDNAGNEMISPSSAWQVPTAQITSVTPPVDKTYLLGEDLDFIANFDRSVTVTGTPRVELDIGGNTVYAEYLSGSPGTALTFRYTAQSGDNDADGIAHASPLDLNGGTISDTASSNPALLTFTPADTSAVLVSTVIVATKLVFVDQPTNTVAGSNMTPAITVELRDNSDNLDTSATDNVTLSFGSDPSSGNASLGGTITVAAVAGVATFSDINIDKAFTGYTLTASTVGLTDGTSSSFDISPATKSQLVFKTEPVDSEVGVNITPAFSVEIQDAFGNKTNDTDTITLSIANDPSGVPAILSGTTSAAAINGELSFSDINIDQYGVGYTLSATAGGLTSATSASFNINAPAAKLAFGTQPSDSSAGISIGPAITVEVQDTNGNIVTTATNNITLSFGTDPSGGSAILNGTLTVAAVNGIATFSDIDVDLDFADYTLTAVASGLTSATSNPFDIIPAAPTFLNLVTPASSPDSDSTPTIEVGGVQSGDSVALFLDASCTNLTASFTSTGTTVNVTTSSLSNGLHTLYANRTNSNSSTSPCSTASLTYEVIGALDQLDTLDTLGNWSNVGGDDRDWTIKTGETPSNGVGPTSGSGGSGGYAYTEASNPVVANDEFFLQSNTVDGSLYHLAIAFKWNKRGDNMGDLYLEASSDGGSTWSSVWSHLGGDIVSGGVDVWRDQFVDLCSLGYTTNNVVLRFKGVMPSSGNVWNSDISLDDLHITSGGCQPAAPATVAISSFPSGSSIDINNQSSFTIGGTCSDNGQNIVLSGDVSGTTTCASNSWSFTLDLSAHADGNLNMIATHSSSAGGANGIASKSIIKDASTYQLDEFDTLGNWIQGTGDNRDWSIRIGGTPSSGVGPNADVSGTGGYIYTEASSPVAANDEFHLRSNSLPAGTYNLKMSFNWNKRGNNMGDLYLEVSSDGGSNWTSIWSHLGVDVAGGATDIWRTTTIDLCNAGYNSGNIMVRFRGVMPSTGDVWNSDIALDNVKFSVDGCP